MYVFDRFEGDKAIIEYSNNSDDNISVFEVEKSRLSSDVREGDVIYCKENIFYTDKVATDERRKEVAKKLKELANPVKKKNPSEILKIYLVINCVYLFSFVFVTEILGFFPGYYPEGFLRFYSVIGSVSLIFYVFYGICALHIALAAGFLIYAIYNRIKNKAKKSFVFTVIVSTASIILNIYGNHLANWICRQ